MQLTNNKEMNCIIIIAFNQGDTGGKAAGG
jgi:hypothetical protein